MSKSKFPTVSTPIQVCDAKYAVCSASKWPIRPGRAPYVDQNGSRSLVLTNRNSRFAHWIDSKGANEVRDKVNPTLRSLTANTAIISRLIAYQ
jgi:hypothetical protein